jgi:hypothetical protein
MTHTQHQCVFSRDALHAGEFDAVIHAALVELSQLRPLRRAEIRLRCLTSPKPWRALQIDRTTFYRRLKRQKLASQHRDQDVA